MLLAVLALAGCPAAPPLSVPPTDEVYAPGPAIGERPAAPDAGHGRERGSVLATGHAGGGAPAARLPDGESCYDGSECESGVCEGEGCGVDQPGRCVPGSRPCSADEAVFCSCDGETFRAPSDCPGQPYRARRACGSGRGAP